MNLIYNARIRKEQEGDSKWFPDRHGKNLVMELFTDDGSVVSKSQPQYYKGALVHYYDGVKYICFHPEQNGNIYYIKHKDQLKLLVDKDNPVVSITNLSKKEYDLLIIALTSKEQFDNEFSFLLNKLKNARTTDKEQLLSTCELCKTHDNVKIRIPAYVNREQAIKEAMYYCDDCFYKIFSASIV